MASAPGLEGSVRAAAVDAATQAAPLRRRVAHKKSQLDNFVTFDALPPHQKDNRYILRYYRSGYGVRRSLRSLFAWHNETGNIWSHLIGAVIFVCLVSVTIKLSPTPLSLTPHSLARLERRLVAAGKANLAELAQSVEEWERSVVRFGEAGLEAVESALSSVGPHNVADLTHRLASYGTDRLAEADAALHRAVANLLDAQWPIRRWPVYVFLGGAIACMFISSLCHLLGCCAEHIATRLWRFDYVGIAVLVVTSIVPPVYYVFFCHPTARAVYLAAASVLGAATVAVSLFPAFQHPDYYALRAGTFVALGAWGVIPLMHGWSLHFGEQAVGFAVGLECVMAAIYLAGAALYTLRVPERWKPGFFDVVGHSHQLFHVAVVVAACVHFKATHILLQWREGVGGCVAPGEKAFL